MATTLYLLLTDGPDFTAGSDLDLGTARGDGVTEYSRSTTASGNHLIFATTPNSQIAWWYRVSAVTISGTISFNVWAYESAMNVNATIGIRIARTDSSGTEISDVVADANAGHLDNAESGTSVAVQTWTATPTSTSFNDGDYIKVVAHADAFGTMASGSESLAFNGTSAGVSGDTYISFTETITEYVAATNPPRSTPYPQLLAH